MTKLKIASLMAGVALLAIPAAAFAATTQTFITLDGQTTATIQAGDSVDGVLTFNNTGNSTVQSLKIEIPGSQFPPTCINVADQNSTGTHTVAFPVSTNGATEGTWDVRITTYGIPVNQTGANNNCDGTIGVSNTHTFNNVLTLTQSQSTGDNANNTGTGSTASAASQSSQLDKLIALMTAWLHPTTPATTSSAVCTAYAQANSGTQMSVYNSANVRLQGFLLSQGASIPALTAGASFGFFGPQTQAAVSSFQATNHCI